VVAHRDTPTRSRAGATAAATRYVQLGQQLFDRSPTERRRLLQEMAARAAIDGFVASQARQLRELDAIEVRGQGRLTWHVAVLATRVDAYTPHRARVALWRVGILTVGGLVAPLSEWGTVTYELVWERGAWRVWSETDAPGPTPMGHPEAHPSTPRELRAELRGFRRYPEGGSL
jgi:hypothetical protein